MRVMFAFVTGIEGSYSGLPVQMLCAWCAGERETV